MKKMAWILFGALLASTSSADTGCFGKVTTVYKWNWMTSLSIKITTNDGILTPWISLPTKSDEAMALVAYSTGKPVVVYWSAADVSACLNGWAENRALTGFLQIY